MGVGLLALVGSACKTEDSKAVKAVAEVRNTDGASVGTATFEATEGGVKLHFEGKGLPQGPHGIHLHEHGLCDAPTFESAGDHFNPTNAMHGMKNPKGPHVGDLGNLEVAADGTGTHDFVIKGATLEASGERSLLAGDATALVIHANADDQITDPAGDAGDRIACGVLRRD